MEEGWWWCGPRGDVDGPSGRHRQERLLRWHPAHTTIPDPSSIEEEGRSNAPSLDFPSWPCRVGGFVAGERGMYRAILAGVAAAALMATAPAMAAQPVAKLKAEAAAKVEARAKLAQEI